MTHSADRTGAAVRVGHLRTCIVPGCHNPAVGLQCDECQARQDRAGATIADSDGPAYLPSADPAERGVSEGERQAEGVATMESRGWTVYLVGISQAGRVHQTPGVPDTFCVHEARRLVCWVEWKRPVGGELSAAQVEFRRLMLLVGVPHVVASQVAHVATLHLTLTPLSQPQVTPDNSQVIPR